MAAKNELGHPSGYFCLWCRLSGFLTLGWSAPPLTPLSRFMTLSVKRCDALVMSRRQSELSRFNSTNAANISLLRSKSSTPIGASAATLPLPAGHQHLQPSPESSVRVGSEA
eukprot:1159652-Pelagomonas_calceolata.AAC.14